MSAVMQEIDPKGAGELTKDMFTAWYIKSEKRIHAQVKVTRRGGCNCAKRPHVWLCALFFVRAHTSRSLLPLRPAYPRLSLRLPPRLAPPPPPTPAASSSSSAAERFHRVRGQGQRPGQDHRGRTEAAAGEPGQRREQVGAGRGRGGAWAGGHPRRQQGCRLR
jgi:hypothetical protein